MNRKKGALGKNKNVVSGLEDNSYNDFSNSNLSSPSYERKKQLSSNEDLNS
jgi:hypothetical protein